MLLDLVLYVCMTIGPTEVCRRERAPWGGSMMECATQSQLRVAEWSAAHPAWRVVRWTCGPARIEV